MCWNKSVFWWHIKYDYFQNAQIYGCDVVNRDKQWEFIKKSRITLYKINAYDSSISKDKNTIFEDSINEEDKINLEDINSISEDKINSCDSSISKDSEDDKIQFLKIQIKNKFRRY